MKRPAPDFGVALPTESWSTIAPVSAAALIAVMAALTACLLALGWQARRRGQRLLPLALVSSGALGVAALGSLGAEAHTAFPDHDRPLIASLPGVSTTPAPSRVDAREVATLLEQRYGLSGVEAAVTSGRIEPAAIAGEVVVTGPEGQRTCSLKPVALVDGDRTYQRIAIMCDGQELPTAPGHRPTGTVAAPA